MMCVLGENNVGLYVCKCAWIVKVFGYNLYVLVCHDLKVDLKWSLIVMFVWNLKAWLAFDVMMLNTRLYAKKVSILLVKAT